MNNLPAELVNLIATYLSTSPIDQLSFLTSHPNHLNAFIQFSSNDAKYRFKNHFSIESLDFQNLCAIYQSLQRLAKADYQSVSESRYQYSLERRRGFLDNELRLSRSSSASLSKEWARKQITNATFAFAFEQSPRSQNSTDSDQFVLVHTLNGRHFCTVTSWPRCLSFHLPYEVMGQDLLLNDGLLFLMPLPSKKTRNEKLVLLVLDLRQGQGYEEKGRFYWSKGRRPPNVYKESGERRLYAHGDRIVQILPSDVWTLLVYCISEMQLVQSIEMPWADPQVIGQLFCADQQGPQLLLAFFGEKQHDDDNTYPAKVVTFVIDEADDAAKLLEVSVPKVRSSRFDLDAPVAHIQLFLCAATCYQIDLQQLQLYHFARRCSSHSRPLQPLVIFLFPDGNLTSNATYQDMVCPLGSGGKYQILPELWEFNELVVKDFRVFVMHKIPSIGRLIYATDLNFQLLWKLEVDHFGDPRTAGSKSLLHGEQRLYLYASHGCVWLSDAQGCLLVDQEKGCFRGHLRYPKYDRQLPELESLHEDTSPYAQTGFSIWDIQMSGNILRVVHDIERCCPVILDKITL